ncbi:hypothetical protein PHYSODRAFT_340989 [Phytophthora sojae]|uniref:Uncharacterized protein n=1 Tax=Phytophthora sojae (strain P6497) TaxID=1094619 RepID=G5ABS8_PHYSP|nr:hypothetical protein PHYSODRAFT_340989 [Phytophthora sojae]EGZ06803.1 hypothetical protein PHYSODRAFT_340989 [Phytophthora sojae]|eukprot:XP_009537567.1 hypothetical protein PHYSODRAFT_340989 [Phytophthora sojae]
MAGRRSNFIDRAPTEVSSKPARGAREAGPRGIYGGGPSDEHSSEPSTALARTASRNSDTLEYWFLPLSYTVRDKMAHKFSIGLSISTASGEAGLNQPQFPAARRVNTALWSESAEVAGQRSLRSHDDTYGKGELDVADADDQETTLELLKKIKINPVKWAKAKWTDHKLRRAERLAEKQKSFKQDMETMAYLQEGITCDLHEQQSST